MFIFFIQVMFVIYDLFVWAGLATAQQNGKLIFLKISKMLFNFQTQLANQGEKREAGTRVIFFFCCVMNFILSLFFCVESSEKSLDLELSSENSLLQANPVESGSRVWIGIKQRLKLPTWEVGIAHTQKNPRAGGSRVSWESKGGSITCDKRGLN